jgi:hypothetical protein
MDTFLTDRPPEIAATRPLPTDRRDQIMFFPDDIQRLEAAAALANRWIRRHWPVPRRHQ